MDDFIKLSTAKSRILPTKYVLQNHKNMTFGDDIFPFVYNSYFI